MKKSHLIKINFLFLIIIALTFCNEEPTSVDNNKSISVDDEFSSKIEIITEMEIGSQDLPFFIRVAAKDSNESSILDGKKIRWDFNSDNIFEREWSLSDTMTYVFPNTGIHIVNVQVNLAQTSVAECKKIVYTGQLIDLLAGDTTYSVHEMCYNFNESEIYFVWGTVPHDIYRMGNNGGNIQNVTANLEHNSCRHYPISSRDGKYIAYSHESALYLLDLFANEEKIINSPFSYCSNYFTNESKFILTTTPNCEGVHLIDIETGEDSLLIADAHYVSVVPYKNEIGYLNYADENDVAELIIYDLVNNQVKLRFENIPFKDPFKILEDYRAIYFTNKHILYELFTGTSYRINVENVMIQWPSEIANDGSNVLLATRKGIKKLIMTQF